MGSAPMSFVAFQIPSSSAGMAFAFHWLVSTNDAYIRPRTPDEIRQFAEEGELFGVRRSDSAELVALSYVTLEKNAWEVGGLAVIEEAQDLGVATLLARFVVALTIANNRPWFYGQEIIAYVHEANRRPRRILKRLGFEQREKVELRDAPQSMERNSEGRVIRDKFRFPPSAIRKLSDWFDGFDGTLAQDKAVAMFELHPRGIAGLKEALHEAVMEGNQ